MGQCKIQTKFYSLENLQFDDGPSVVHLWSGRVSVEMSLISKLVEWWWWGEHFISEWCVQRFEATFAIADLYN